MTLHLPPEPRPRVVHWAETQQELHYFTTEQLRADRLAVARAVVEQCAKQAEYFAAHSVIARTIAQDIRALLEDSHGV